MFIGYYELDGQQCFTIYYKNKYGYEAWCKDTFSPMCENIEILDFKISGYNYKERKESLEELAISWQLHFSHLSWSYSELAEIQNWL